jgi:hypothetical protein
MQQDKAEILVTSAAGLHQPGAVREAAPLAHQVSRLELTQVSGSSSMQAVCRGGHHHVMPCVLLLVKAYLCYSRQALARPEPCQLAMNAPAAIHEGCVHAI